MPLISLNRSCPICNETKGECIAPLQFTFFDGIPLPTSFDVVACCRCGFVFNDIENNPSAIDAFYEKYSFYATSGGVASGGTSTLDSARYEQTLAFINKSIPSNESVVFEIGCGKGGFLHFLKQHGYENLYAVDLEPLCIEQIKSAGINAQIGSAVDLPFKNIKADLLLYNAVLEHFFDLQTCLEAAADKLTDNGLVYAEVPDAMRYNEHPIFPYYWFSQIEHINHFDMHHLVDLFKSKGFALIESGKKEYQMAEDCFCPMIFGIFKKGSAHDNVTPDLSARDSIAGYIELEKIRLSKYDQVIQNLLSNNKGIYIWGVSLELSTLLAHTKLNECNIKGFIDNNKDKQKRTLLGIPIYPQQKISGASQNEAVVITSTIYQEEMVAHLQQIDFPGEIILLT